MSDALCDARCAGWRACGAAEERTIGGRAGGVILYVRRTVFRDAVGSARTCGDVVVECDACRISAERTAGVRRRKGVLKISHSGRSFFSLCQACEVLIVRIARQRTSSMVQRSRVRRNAGPATLSAHPLSTVTKKRRIHPVFASHCTLRRRELYKAQCDARTCEPTANAIPLGAVRPFSSLVVLHQKNHTSPDTTPPSSLCPSPLPAFPAAACAGRAEPLCTCPARWLDVDAKELHWVRTLAPPPPLPPPPQANLQPLHPNPLSLVSAAQVEPDGMRAAA